MSFNISVPISELQRIGTTDPRTLLVIEQDQITRNVTWAELTSSIAVYPSDLIFGAGSVEQPSVVLGDEDSGFFAPQLGSVAVTTDKERRLLVGPTGVVELGKVEDSPSEEIRTNVQAFFRCDSVVEDNIFIEKDAYFFGDVGLLGDINFNDITLEGSGDGGDLNVSSEYIEIGRNCTQEFKVYNVTRDYCNVIGKTDFTVVQNLQNDNSINDKTTTTKDLVVYEEATFNTITSEETINGNDLIVFDKNGDLTVNRNVDAGFIFGDGQGISNLNIPDSLSFKGGIDPTTEAPELPIQHGDFYYSNANGTVSSDWVDIDGEEIRIGQWIYYFATPETKWVIGAINNLQTPFFMYVDLRQTSTGEKTFNPRITAQNTIDVTGADITSNTLGLSNKAASAKTVAGNPGNYITTKSYVDNRMVNAIFDFKLSTSKYIIGEAYDGALAQTWDLDARVSGNDNLVLRTVDGDFIANEITADYLFGRSNDSKTQDIHYNSTTETDLPLTLVTGTGPSNVVYSDVDLRFSPVEGQLSVDNVVGDITGDITGNVTTFTEFYPIPPTVDTYRQLWSNQFSGGEDINGEVEFAGTITPDTTDTRDLGTSDNVWNDVYATTFYGTLDGNVEVGDSTRQTLTDGEWFTGGPWNGSEAITWEVNDTSDNTPDTIVSRDSSSSFSANVITAQRFGGPLTGNVTGNITGSSGSVTGNAATATKMETPREMWSQITDLGTPSVSGDLGNTGTITPLADTVSDFGSPELKYKTLYADKFVGNFPNNSTSTDQLNNALGRGAYIEGEIGEWDGSVSDTWSIDPRTENVASKTVLRDAQGDFSSHEITATFIGPLLGNVTGDITGISGFVTGNAATATRMATTRSLWGQPFDGRQNVSTFIDSTGNIVPLTDDQYTLGREDKLFTDVYAETFHGYFLDNITDVDKVVSFLTPGAYIEGEAWNGSTDNYWDSFARSENVLNSVVLRSVSNEFVASTISSDFEGPLTGNVTGNITGSSGSVTGNTATTSKFLTEREITVTVSGMLEGTGSFMFDGSSNVSGDVEVQLGNVDISNLSGLPQ